LLSFRKSIVKKRKQYFENIPKRSYSKYSSRFNNFNHELNETDDIESMTYLILKLCFGKLSWE